MLPIPVNCQKKVLFLIGCVSDRLFTILLYVCVLMEYFFEIYKWSYAVWDLLYVLICSFLFLSHLKTFSELFSCHYK